MSLKRKLEKQETEDYSPNFVANLEEYIKSGEYIKTRIQNSASFLVLKIETKHLETYNEQFSNIFSYNETTQGGNK